MKKRSFDFYNIFKIAFENKHDIVMSHLAKTCPRLINKYIHRREYEYLLKFVKVDSISLEKSKEIKKLVELVLKKIPNEDVQHKIYNMICSN
jgi:hypothetical protein